MWNVPLVIYQSTLVHRILIVLMPAHLGLFSPAVLDGKAEPGGLESLDRGVGTKLAASIPYAELSTLGTLRIAGVEARGSVVALHHSSGKEFVVNSLSPTLARTYPSRCRLNRLRRRAAQAGGAGTRLCVPS